MIFYLTYVWICMYGYLITITLQRHDPLVNITHEYHFHRILLKRSCLLMNLKDNHILGLNSIQTQIAKNFTHLEQSLFLFRHFPMTDNHLPSLDMNETRPVLTIQEVPCSVSAATWEG